MVQVTCRRALIPFLEKYIPGGPKIIIENMPRAAGMKAVNHAYTTAKPDGLTITGVGSGVATGPILGMPAVRYDLDKLIYLVSTESGDPYVFLSRKHAGFDSLEKLRAVGTDPSKTETGEKHDSDQLSAMPAFRCSWPRIRSRSALEQQ